MDPVAEGRAAAVAALIEVGAVSAGDGGPRRASRSPGCRISSAWRSAWYDERTIAPTAACRKPIAYASRSNIANVVRMHVAQHRQVAAGRLQVLADRQHVDVVRAHVAHHREDLVVGLAQAHHQAGLGRDRPGSAP